MNKMIFEKVNILNKRQLKLAAVVGSPDKSQKHPAVVLLHGFTGYKDEEHLVELAQYLTSFGYVTIRFDCSGFAESEGDMETDYRLSNYYSDTEVVFEYLKTLKDVDRERLAIWGNSLGGTLALCFASKNSWLKAVCAVSAPTVFARKDNFERRTKKWQEMGYFEKESSRYGNIKIPYEYVVDSKKWNALESVENIKIPSLYIIGLADKNVFPENTRELFNKANDPKELIEIEGMDHFYKKKHEQLKQVNESVLKFLKKYL